MTCLSKMQTGMKFAKNPVQKGICRLAILIILAMSTDVAALPTRSAAISGMMGIMALTPDMAEAQQIRTYAKEEMNPFERREEIERCVRPILQDHGCSNKLLKTVCWTGWEPLEQTDPGSWKGIFIGQLAPILQAFVTLRGRVCPNVGKGCQNTFHDSLYGENQAGYPGQEFACQNSNNGNWQGYEPETEECLQPILKDERCSSLLQNVVCWAGLGPLDYISDYQGSYRSLGGLAPIQQAWSDFREKMCSSSTDLEQAEHLNSFVGTLKGVAPVNDTSCSYYGYNNTQYFTEPTNCTLTATNCSSTEIDGSCTKNITTCKPDCSLVSSGCAVYNESSNGYGTIYNNIVYFIEQPTNCTLTATNCTSMEIDDSCTKNITTCDPDCTLSNSGCTMYNETFVGSATLYSLYLINENQGGYGPYNITQYFTEQPTNCTLIATGCPSTKIDGSCKNITTCYPDCSLVSSGCAVYNKSSMGYGTMYKNTLYFTEPTSCTLNATNCSSTKIDDSCTNSTDCSPDCTLNSSDCTLDNSTWSDSWCSLLPSSNAHAPGSRMLAMLVATLTGLRVSKSV